MGFGGATAAMITSLKNNNRRNKREAFDGWTSSSKTSQGIKIEPVSEEILQEIRNKLKRQKRQTTIINLGIIILSIVISIIVIYFLFSYFENDPGISNDFLYKQSN